MSLDEGPRTEAETETGGPAFWECDLGKIALGLQAWAALSAAARVFVMSTCGASLPQGAECFEIDAAASKVATHVLELGIGGREVL